MEKYFGQPLFSPPVKVPKEARDSLSKLVQKELGRCPFASPGGHLGISTSERLVRTLQAFKKPHNNPRHSDTPISPALSSYTLSTTMSADGRTTAHGANDIMKLEIQSANGHSGIIPSKKPKIDDRPANLSQRLDSTDTTTATNVAVPGPRGPIEEETRPSSQSVKESTNPPLKKTPSTKNPGGHLGDSTSGPLDRILQEMEKPHKIPRHLDTPIPPALSSYKPSTSMSSDGRTTTNGTIGIMKSQIQSANGHSRINPSKKPKIDDRPTNFSQRLDSTDRTRATNVAGPGPRGPINEETRPSSQWVKKCTDPPLKKPPSTKNPGGHLGDSTSGPLDRILQEMERPHNIPRHLDTPIPPALSSYKPSTSMSFDGRTTTHGAIDTMKPQIQSANGHSGITPSKKPIIDDRPNNLSQRLHSTDTTRATNVVGPGPRGPFEEDTRPFSQSVKKSTNPPLTKPPSTSNSGFYKMIEMPVLLSPLPDSDTCLNVVSGKKETQTEPEVFDRSKDSKPINNPIDKEAKLEKNEINRQPSNMRSTKQFGRSLGIDYLLPLNLSEESDSEEETKPCPQSVEKSTNPPLEKPPSTKNPGGHLGDSTSGPLDRILQEMDKSHNIPRHSGTPIPPALSSYKPSTTMSSDGRTTTHGAIDIMKPQVQSANVHSGIIPSKKPKIDDRLTNFSQRLDSTDTTRATNVAGPGPRRPIEGETRPSFQSVKKSTNPPLTECVKVVSGKKKAQSKPEGCGQSRNSKPNNNPIDKGAKLKNGKLTKSFPSNKNRPSTSVDEMKIPEIVNEERIKKKVHKETAISVLQSMSQATSEDKSGGHKKRRVKEDSMSEQDVRPSSHETDPPARLETNPEEPHEPATLQVLQDYHSYFERIFSEEGLRFQHTSWTSERTKLAILSYRCQALLYYKLFIMGLSELREKHNIIADFFTMRRLGDPLRQDANIATHPADGPNQMGTNQGTRSLSFIPLPADSNSSVESQSSGYSSSSTDQAWFNRPTIPLPSPPVSLVKVPTNVFDSMKRQNTNLQYLFSYQKLWKQADNLINGDNRDFFNTLDNKLKRITPGSKLSDVAEYVREGIRMIKNGS